MSLTQEAREEVERLIQLGQKINAIKYLQDTFGISLSDAKLLVDTLDKERAPVLQVRPADLSLEGRNAVELFLRENKKIDAIKLVREKLGLGLKEALDYVEGIEQQINPNFAKKSGCKGNVIRVIAFFFSFIGLVMLGFALILYVMDAGIVKDENRTEAVVVDLVGSNTRAPVIAYTWQGKEYTYQGTVYSSPPAFEINERVMVFVNPAKPGEVIIDTFSERWLAVAIFSGIGGIFTFLGIIILFNSRKF